MNISQNLSHIIKEKKITQKALSKQLGVPTSTINNWIKLNRSIPSEFIIPICEFLDITPYLLLTGENVSSKSVLGSDEQELLDIYNSLSPKSQGRLRERAEVLAELEVPIVKEPEQVEEPTIQIKHSYYRVSAGTGFDLPEGDNWEMIDIPDTPEARKADFAITIKGNSMEPVYFDGDIVLVKQQPAVELGEIGIFNIENNGYIKKFGGDRLISLNDAYDDIILSEYDEDCNHCLGKVIGRV